jgi:outer membrane protein TolC
MDVFINLGKTGYADSFRGSVDDIGDGESSDWTTGFQFSYPLGNRAARARNKRAELSLLQSQEALENLDQLAQVDVRTAYIEVNRTREQVDATAVTRQFQEESLRVETEKFRVGKSTSILVAQAQRDLLSSQIAEIQSVINYHKAIIELYRLDGSLLERRGISAPGNEHVVLAVTRQ